MWAGVSSSRALCVSALISMAIVASAPGTILFASGVKGAVRRPNRVIQNIEWPGKCRLIIWKMNSFAEVRSSVTKVRMNLSLSSHVHNELHHMGRGQQQKMSISVKSTSVSAKFR